MASIDLEAAGTDRNDPFFLQCVRVLSADQAADHAVGLCVRELVDDEESGLTCLRVLR